MYLVYLKWCVGVIGVVIQSCSWEGWQVGVAQVNHTGMMRGDSFYPCMLWSGDDDFAWEAGALARG